MIIGMGFLRETVGKVTVESRSESFVVHPGYGYDEDGEPTSVVVVRGRPEVRASFCRRWREDPHPEFLYAELDDLVQALTRLRDDRRQA
jgi:hypothetical protein